MKWNRGLCLALTLAVASIVLTTAADAQVPTAQYVPRPGAYVDPWSDLEVESVPRPGWPYQQEGHASNTARAVGPWSPAVRIPSLPRTVVGSMMPQRFGVGRSRQWIPISRYDRIHTPNSAWSPWTTREPNPYAWASPYEALPQYERPYTARW
jgi:hypothetical protein